MTSAASEIRGWAPSAIRRHPLPAFFGIAFAISWSLWGSLFFLAPEGWDISASPIILLPALLGGIGSSASGVIVILASHGKAGLRLLFGRLRQKTDPAWYVVALSTVPVMLLATLVITDTPLDADVSFKIGTGFMIGGVAALIEEFGWRGFALPTLQRKYHSAIISALVLGAIWASWHTLPAYWGKAGSYGSLWLPDFLVFALSLVAYSMFITWIFNRTKGNMLIAVLLHAVYSGGQFVLLPLAVSPAENIQLAAVFMAVLWIAAGFLLLLKPRGVRKGDEYTFVLKEGA